MIQPAAGSAEQFKQSFREEAREILAELESTLLELNENLGDAELVGRIFRGLHTIKGSGSMFGFECLAAFTHDLETAFDLVRNGRLAVSPELVDLTLAALDQISAMLEEGGGAAPADQGICNGILKSVRRLAGIQGAALPVKKAEPAPNGCPADAGPMRSWRIRFAPSVDLMRCGASPFLLLRELRQLGGLAMKASMAAVPPLAELDAERCYVAWEMVLATAAGRDVIRDVFIFVEDSCELSIEPDGEVAHEPAGRSQRNEADAWPWRSTEQRTHSPAGASMTSPTTRPACECPPSSWINLSTWWESW